VDFSGLAIAMSGVSIVMVSFFLPWLGLPNAERIVFLFGFTICVIGMVIHGIAAFRHLFLGQTHVDDHEKDKR
jgi:hypothetical protein